MHEIAERSLGVSVGIILPLSRHFVLRGNLTRFGNVDEIGGRLTYYLRKAERDTPRANPYGSDLRFRQNFRQILRVTIDLVFL